jgi:uncharacterized membrane protein
MRTRGYHRAVAGRGQRAFTMAEMLLAVGIGSVVLTMIMVLYLFGLRSFSAMSNYAQLSGKSRLALDRMSRDIRQATNVLAFSTNLPAPFLKLATYDSIITYSWDSTAGVVTSAKTDQTGTTTTTNLTGCDFWSFTLYQRTPTNMYSFYTTTNGKLCKLINMYWKCSRSILGKKVNTEDVMTAQVVIRNMNISLSN